MCGKILRSVLLIGGILLATFTARAQQSTAAPKGRPTDIDIAVTYVAERGKVVSLDCGCFWMNGGSANAAVTFFHGLGVAANLTGVHASDIQPGVDLDKVMFAMGPRYTYRPEHWKNRYLGGGRMALFGEGLIGGAHAFNTIIPSSNGIQGAASSFAIQVGGGMDVRATRTVGIRLFEADYVRSTLPNNGDNTQHDLRLAGGISFHFRR